VWTQLTPVPDVNPGFAERKRCSFKKPAPQWKLLIDDEPLPDDTAVHDCWSWLPGFFAGEVTAELIDPSGKSALFLLDVAPDASKLGRDIFKRMVDEILNEDPELVLGSEPATIRFGEIGPTQDPWLEFARLRRYAPEFLEALNAIRAKPRMTVRMRRDAVSLHQVRRVDRRTALSVSRTPAVGIIGFARGVSVTSQTSDVQLDVPSIEETVDAAANRAVLALITVMLRRTTFLRDLLQGLVERESTSETRTSLAERWPGRRRVLEILAMRLRTVSLRSPFAGVARAEITSAGLTAIAADPVYARAWGRGWRALRHGISSDERTDRLWISPSWEIYEKWCFVRILRALRGDAPEWKWERSAGGKEWVGQFGDRHAVLSLQPTFRSYPHAGKRRSLSRERVPDLMFSVESADGVRFLLMDSKYRTSRDNVLDAMASAHIYQDSLRIGENRPEASLLLVPRGGGAVWLEDQHFQAIHCVGVYVLSQEQSISLPPFVRKLLATTEQ
jgi:hypothetical protein